MIFSTRLLMQFLRIHTPYVVTIHQLIEIENSNVFTGTDELTLSDYCRNALPGKPVMAEG